MGKLKKYSSYKDSCIEWLGEIPEHWEVKKLKFIIKSKLQYGANESGDTYDENLPRYIRITDFSNSGTLSEKNKLSLPWGKANNYLLKDGDILFARSGATVGKTYQFKTYMSNEKAYAFAGYLIKADANEEIILSDYLYAYTNSNLFEKWKQNIFNKSTIENIGADKYSELSIVLPSLDEQNIIMKYLTKKTEPLDKVISQKEKLIALLKERKQIVINDAVTKGLNKDVELVDSGVAWIGEIPKHWKLLANKYVFKLKKNLVGKKSSEYDLLSLTLEGIIKRDLDKGGKFPAEFDTYQEVKKGDFVFCLFDVEETPRTIGLSKYDGMITGAYSVFSVDNINKEYLYYFYLNLDSKKRLKPLYTGLRNTISKDNFFSFKSFIPPKDEQLQIVEYIENQTTKINKAIELQQNYIQKLKEYKATLIDSVITGKVKVS